MAPCPGTPFATLSWHLAALPRTGTGLSPLQQESAVLGRMSETSALNPWCCAWTTFPITQHHQPMKDVDAGQAAALGFPIPLGGWGFS